GPVLLIARADAERPGPRLADLRAARRGREFDDAELVVVVDVRGRDRRRGVDVPDDGEDARVVAQPGRDRDRLLRPRLVVLEDQLEPAPRDPAGLVDLVGRHLRREAHRPAAGLTDRARDAEVDRVVRRPGAARPGAERRYREGRTRPRAKDAPHHCTSEVTVRRPRWRSKSLRIRRYSSVHELGSTKPWSSTG